MGGIVGEDNRLVEDVAVARHTPAVIVSLFFGSVKDIDAETYRGCKRVTGFAAPGQGNAVGLTAPCAVLVLETLHADCFHPASQATVEPRGEK